MIHTVLFDLDGTLVQHGHTLLPPILKEWGYPRPLAAIDAVVHENIHWIYARVNANGGLWTPAINLEFYERILTALDVYDAQGLRARELVDYFADQPVPPVFDDAPPLLEAMRTHDWRLGIITQRSRAGAEKFLRAHGLTELFQTIVAGDDGHGRKPNAGPFHAALHHLQSAGPHAVFIGDRIDDDCEGALAAGLRTAFLIDRAGIHAETAAGRTDFIHLAELVDLLAHLPEQPHK
ncbi:MAG: HAD family hydrolase [Caldilineaceae bacterium]|nr:HAD family hydrolase [Caldilineaceae bacterium]